MKKQEFIDRILSEREGEVKVIISGWFQSEEWVGGTNPFCDDYTWCGVVVNSNESEFIGKIVKKTYHGSYNGVYESWEFLNIMETCPEMEEFIPAEYPHGAGTQFHWENGQFDLELKVSYKKFPTLNLWNQERKALEDKIQRTIDTRRKPGVKFGFHNWGYHRDTFTEYPRIPDSVEKNHYQSGCEAVICFFYSWKRFDNPNVDKMLICELA